MSESSKRGPYRVYIPRDSAALALGADRVAAAVATEATQRGIAVDIVRNGSRGLFWLEPLVEVETPAGRIGYSNVQAAQVAALFDSGWPACAVQDAEREVPADNPDGSWGAPMPACVGRVDAIPYLARQQRLTFARIGVTDPLSPADYEAHGGLVGLRACLALDAAAGCQTVLDSGLRGRGGAAFPAGIKWQTVSRAQAATKYVVCNADEGDSGTFADRLIMESDPFVLIEGMAIAALCVGASEGIIYVRSEYPHAIAALESAIVVARREGWLGPDVLGSGRACELRVAKAAGAYICGEETALLESLEGKRGVVRAKPPIPAVAGLFGQPTLVNNVVTLASVPFIFAHGADAYREFGMGRSQGTLAVQLAGNVRRGGLVELAFGVTLRTLLDEFGGGTASGRAAKAIQVGGPLGAYLPSAQWDVPMDYEAYASLGAVVGHGGVVVHDDMADLAALASYAMQFCAHESCGKCTPCRIGATRGVEVIDQIRRGDTSVRQVKLLRDLCDTMVAGSLCAMGGMTPFPVRSALEHFPADFGLPDGAGRAEAA
ncbi:formate dehydrogenase [Pandoraea cepalis]|uniref:Formate dehydrogenase n=1 Tax=Pandoraea cepalis TaxID=2508294 RepID=A0AAW7MGS5_9BURK|nr:formate dehydrogenase beta subunit [Pandoraea cepalis]MDN4571960.1 formate dehydrogenase [Pandoraea cepalis]MDN4578515.1 formate dehydrogenase [Pandoraea cepalis]